MIGYSIYVYLPPANQTTWLSPLSSASSTWLAGTTWPPMRRSLPATPPPLPARAVRRAKPRPAAYAPTLTVPRVACVSCSAQ